ncbi:hypothetical protein ABK040_014374 [Willaertia magna]
MIKIRGSNRLLKKEAKRRRFNGRRRDEEEEENINDDEEDDDDDDEESLEEEEEYEPQLKYQRLGGSLNSIFSIEGNYASALAVCEKFLALGTHLGYLYILDFEGNNNHQQQFRPHAESINDLSIDSTGEYIATCSNDGKVVIYNIYAALNSNIQNPQLHQKILDPNIDPNLVKPSVTHVTTTSENNMTEFFFGRPVKSVALDPLYGQQKEHAMVSGGKTEKLTLKKKGWFGSYKEVVIHKGEGAIHAVRWFGDFIAWANDLGVKIYDITLNQKITYISRPSNAPRPDMYRCCLVWCQPNRFYVDTRQSDNRDTKNLAQLLIGWGHSITLIVLKERRIPKEQKIQRFVEVLGMFDVDFSICGLSPYSNENLLLILAYDETEEEDENGKKKLNSPRPELRIIDLRGEERSCDALAIKNYENYFALDYRLEIFNPLVPLNQFVQDEVYYILSQRDIVVARPRDADDHIKWLVQRNRFMEALAYAKENESQLKVFSVVEIGKRNLNYLLENQKYNEAAQLVPNVSGKDQQLWEEWIYSFIDLKQFHVIIPYIPIDNPRLSDAIYEMKLNYFLLNSPEQFLNCIKEWPHDIYKIQNIATVTAENIKSLEQEMDKEKLEGREQEAKNLENKIVTLLNALATLHLYDQQFDKALAIYFKLRRSDVFEFIQDHKLFSSVQDKVLTLMTFSEDRALRLFVEHNENIAIEQVIRQLKDNRKQLLKYLDGLFFHNVRAAQRYHLIQVELYAEYDSKRLLWFLEQSQSYNIEQALKICETYLNKPIEDKIEYLYRRDTLPFEQVNSTTPSKLDDTDETTLSDDENTDNSVSESLSPREKRRNLNNNEDDFSLEERNKQIYKGIVYLLGRMGNTNDALGLIIDKLEDVKLAIEFVEKQPDVELYQDLITKSLKKPKFISGLLDHISENGSDYIDPLSLVKKIPEGMDIEGLKRKLTNLITDSSQQKTLQEGCQQILQADIKQQSSQLFKQQRKGVRVRFGNRCALCGQRVSSSKEDSLVFMSGFTYHSRCYIEYSGMELNEEVGENNEATSKATKNLLRGLGPKVQCIITQSREKTNTRRKQ